MPPPTAPTTSVVRVGLFGLLGARNLGNDGSAAVVIDRVRTLWPDVALDVMCTGPEAMSQRYGITATRMHYFGTRPPGTPLLRRVVRGVLGKFVDIVHLFRWVRRHDLVIVPGTGVLEATIPLRAWQMPYSLFLLCATARVAGTRTALLNVGSEVLPRGPLRTFATNSARLASYLSFRDEMSRSAMHSMGIDTTADEVHRDLIFALPDPVGVQPVPGRVALGVMDYHGSNRPEDRQRAAAIHSNYVDAMSEIACWLIQSGMSVHLMVGDHLDDVVVATVAAAVRARHPDLDPRSLITGAPRDHDELLVRMAEAEFAIATRFHNILTALKLAKPTIAISYSEKSDLLMEAMGVGTFCHDAAAIDVEQVKKQFSELVAERDRYASILRDHSGRHAQDLHAQLSRVMSLAVAPRRRLRL